MIDYKMGSLRGFIDTSYAPKECGGFLLGEKPNKVPKLHLKILKLITSLSLIKPD